MKKQNSKPTILIERPLTEEEYDEIVSEENFRLEQEGYLNHFSQFSKEELIQIVIKMEERLNSFSGWLLLKNWGMKEIRAEFGRLRNEREHRIKNQKIGRQDQAIKKMSQKPEAQALGIDDFYGLLREAVAKFDKTPIDQIPKQPKATTIRKIIVDLLCQPNYSQHNHEKDKWIDIVKRNVTSKHIDNAKQQLKRIKPKAT